MTDIEELKSASQHETGSNTDGGLSGIEPDTGQLNTETAEEAAGEDDNDSPGCLFYSCFACAGGHCTALKDNDFDGRPCPFFKTAEQAEKDRKDVFDHLLLAGRLDLVNRYEEVLVALGVEDPEDAKVPIDPDVMAAREELKKYREDFDGNDSGTDKEDGFCWDDEDGDTGESCKNEASGQEASGETDCGIQ